MVVGCAPVSTLQTGIFGMPSPRCCGHSDLKGGSIH
jgi:hypothetical protein